MQNVPEENSIERIAGSEAPGVRIPEGASRVAVIDLGSNSIRLLIAQCEADGRVRVLNCVKSMVKLGEGAFESRTLQEEAVERTLSVLRTFSGICASYGVSSISAVATASVREAENGARFTELARTMTGITFNVISGPEEARLIALGVEAGLPKSDAVRLVMDIGGGSTEFALFRKNHVLEAESLRVGCVRLADIFFSGRTGPVSEDTFRAVKNHVRDKAVMPFRRLLAGKPEEFVASSGTAAAIADMAYALREGGAKQDFRAERTRVITIEEVRRVVKMVCEADDEARANLPGMSQRRVGVIVPGAAIFLSAMERLGFERVTVTDRGLRDGVLLQHLMNEGLIPGEALEAKQRFRSVKALAKMFSADGRHAETVANLALSLFDDARACGLHEFDERWDEILRSAAWLEETGIAVSYLRYSRHSAYIAANAELLGFTLHETQLIGAVIFEEKNFNEPYPPYISLPPDDWGTAAVLGGYLRAAASLDKSHSGAVSGVKLGKEGGGLKLTVFCRKRTPVETDAARRMVKAFSRLTALPVTLSWNGEACEPALGAGKKKKSAKKGKKEK